MVFLYKFIVMLSSTVNLLRTFSSDKQINFVQARLTSDFFIINPKKTLLIVATVFSLVLYANKPTDKSWTVPSNVPLKDLSSDSGIRDLHYSASVTVDKNRTCLENVILVYYSDFSIDKYNDVQDKAKAWLIR